MLVFNVVPSMNLVEPATQYFVEIESAATGAQMEAVIGSAQAWSLCEYLDAVDSGSIPVKKVLYRQCVAALSEFLAQRSSTMEVASLVEKSWAAKTLLEVIKGCPVCKELGRQAG
jgi:hypothetical protein